MTHTVVNRTSIRRNWIFTIIALINIAAIAWVLFMGHIGVAIHEVVSYGDARELIHKGIIDVDALQELRGEEIHQEPACHDRERPECCPQSDLPDREHHRADPAARCDHAVPLAAGAEGDVISS